MTRQIFTALLLATLPLATSAETVEILGHAIDLPEASYDAEEFRQGNDAGLYDPMTEWAAEDRDEFGDLPGTLGGGYDDYHNGLTGTTELYITTGSGSGHGTDATFRFYVGSSDYRTLGGAKNPNTTYKWSWSNSSWWEDLDGDDWDNLKFYATSGDGVYVTHVKLIHNYETVIDMDTNSWVDRYHGRNLYLEAATALGKWENLDLTFDPVVYTAVMDLGQTGSAKYVSRDVAWCSEFASWAIRTATGLNTPTGSIGTSAMLSYFDGINRKYTADQIEAGVYKLQAGDYLSINSGGHSILFVEWVDKFVTMKTISGNVGNTVRIKNYSWSKVTDSDGIGGIH